jgi:excisionase family DNA binding protein
MRRPQVADLSAEEIRERLGVSVEDLTPEEVRERLGVVTRGALADAMEVTEQTIYLWVRYKGMPSIKIGSRILFDLDDVRAWLKTRAA